MYYVCTMYVLCMYYVYTIYVLCMYYVCTHTVYADSGPRSWALGSTEYSVPVLEANDGGLHICT